MSTNTQDSLPINNQSGIQNVQLNTFSANITTNATTTVTAVTAYVTSIVISTIVAGTASTIIVQDLSGTPLKMLNGLVSAALSTTPTIISLVSPAKMIGGINIVTSGTVAATINVWVNYYQ